ncbi:hypothetical protein NOR_02114 [Metarhizium rileyi]|uniref:Uncharacterized protein n=1 Tax=Metarhizium rileyi (strain RCEF 4871) TaxID=1649241 RepID=A0A167H8V4_METRR|nr:hypothetical protein NOR_02114 [Metarhizium rileyi RCEF 4871]
MQHDPNRPLYAPVRAVVGAPKPSQGYQGIFNNPQPQQRIAFQHLPFSTHHGVPVRTRVLVPSQSAPPDAASPEGRSGWARREPCAAAAAAPGGRGVALAQAAAARGTGVRGAAGGGDCLQGDLSESPAAPGRAGCCWRGARAGAGAGQDGVQAACAGLELLCAAAAGACHGHGEIVCRRVVGVGDALVGKRLVRFAAGVVEAGSRGWQA